MKNSEKKYKKLVRVYQPIIIGNNYSLYQIESSMAGRLFWIGRLWEEDPDENIMAFFTLDEEPEVLLEIISEFDKSGVNQVNTIKHFKVQRNEKCIRNPKCWEYTEAKYERYALLHDDVIDDVSGKIDV